jgi:hypothetical protein
LSIIISEQDYYQLSKYLRTASDNVPAKGIWLALFNEYNVGIRQVDLITLTATNRAFIREKVKSLTGFDPVDEPAEKLAQRTRTQNSESGKNEKFISLKPREAFLEYRVLTLKADTQGYLGGDVDQVLSLGIETVISVENFDTFASVSYPQLSEAISTSKPILVVYRGDNIASPKAVSKLRNRFNKTWFHFGDFDPQGINIGAVDMKANGIILPVLEDIEANLSLSQKDVYLRQNKNLMPAHIQTPLKDHIELMKSEKLAIMQEHICAHKLRLTSILM